MANVPVGPNRVSPLGQSAEDAPKEPWRETVAASSRTAGNSFKSADHRGKDKKGLPKFKLIALAVAVLLLAGLAFWWMGQQSNVAGQIDKSKFQAVFFTNGQVYFGKLSKVDGDYYKLTDVFYIQEAQNTNSGTDSDNPQETDTSQQGSSPQLIKLGAEIHGPEDAMIINRDQVLFFENLKTDGKVSDVILKDRAQKQ